MERGVPVCVCVRVRACTLSTYRGLAACPCSEVATHPKAVGGQVPGLEPCLEPAEAPARPALSVAQVGPGRGGCEGPAGTGLEEPQRVGTGLWRRRRRRRRKDALGKRLMRPPEPRGSAEDGYGELYFPHLVDLRILILGYRLGFHGFRGRSICLVYFSVCPSFSVFFCLLPRSLFQ